MPLVNAIHDYLRIFHHELARVQRDRRSTWPTTSKVRHLVRADENCFAAAEDVAFTLRTLSFSLFVSEFRANLMGASLALPTHKLGSIQDVAQLAHDTELLNLDRRITQLDSAGKRHTLASGATPNNEHTQDSFFASNAIPFVYLREPDLGDETQLPKSPKILRCAHHRVGASQATSSAPPSRRKPLTLKHTSIPLSARRSERDDVHRRERSPEDPGPARRRERDIARDRERSPEWIGPSRPYACGADAIQDERALLPGPCRRHA
jgi:hypothetical protein